MGILSLGEAAFKMFLSPTLRPFMLNLGMFKLFSSWENYLKYTCHVLYFSQLAEDLVVIELGNSCLIL